MWKPSQEHSSGNLLSGKGGGGFFSPSSLHVKGCSVVQIRLAQQAVQSFLALTRSSREHPEALTHAAESSLPINEQEPGDP